MSFICEKDLRFILKANCGQENGRIKADRIGSLIGFDPKRDMPFKGTRHNALDDAIHQAKYVSVIWKKLAK